MRKYVYTKKGEERASMTLTNYHYVSRRINFRPARRRREAMRWARLPMTTTQTEI